MQFSALPEAASYAGHEIAVNRSNMGSGQMECDSDCQVLRAE